MENQETLERETLEKENICNLGEVYHALFGHLRLREENVAAAAAMLVMSNLGALSQVVDEYDLLHFRQSPAPKLAEFANWLQSEAAHFFEDVGEAAASGADGLRLSEPDAVTITTIHRAKGKEWPAVFVSALVDGRFPHDGVERGRTRWHILPRRALRDARRYDTTLVEEKRLMYVALTRAKKYLHCSFAADPCAAHPLMPSPFLAEFERTVQKLKEEDMEKRLGVQTPEPARLPPQPRTQAQTLTLTFSRLSAFLRCPYLFKLRAVYGWTAPPAEAEGYGKGTHDALAEVHARARETENDGADKTDCLKQARALVARHLLLPYASQDAYDALADTATEQVAAYLEAEAECIAATVTQEMPYEVSLEGELTVTGRNDVIWETEGVRTLREVKSRKDVQSEELSRTQLYVEAMGTQAATGQAVDFIEVYNLAAEGRAGSQTPEETATAGIQFRERFEAETAQKVREQLMEAARRIRARELLRLTVVGQTCRKCDPQQVCRNLSG